MQSRAKILAAVAANQPGHTPLPDTDIFNSSQKQLLERLTEVLTNTGSLVVPVNNYTEISAFITENHFAGKVVTPIHALESVFNKAHLNIVSGYDYADVELAVIPGHFAVAENGAIWVTEDGMVHRALPFITQHLAIVINANDIVANMHQAYNRIADSMYGFGTFISGPSKTADIEQSLVIGAHGSRSLTVFLIAENNKN